jgi:hypothetical protein
MTDESAGGDLVVAERSSSATDYSGEGAGALKRKAQPVNHVAGSKLSTLVQAARSPGDNPGFGDF